MGNLSPPSKWAFCQFLFHNIDQAVQELSRFYLDAHADKEKAEKVSQMVQRTRDWEQGLVGVYQSYLRGLEAELKGAKREARSLLLRVSADKLQTQRRANLRNPPCTVCVHFWLR